MPQCVCPLPTSLVDFTAADCPIDFQQIVKLAFQRIDDANNIFDSTTNPIVDKANWDTFTAAHSSNH